MRILAVASAGGHLTQLLLATQEIRQSAEFAVATTQIGFLPEDLVAEAEPITDFSLTQILRFPGAIIELARVLGRVRPDICITTGAAPGIAAVIAARLRGIPTIWIDSCANAEKISLSGRIAGYIATVSLTQWPHLAGGRHKWIGTVL